MDATLTPSQTLLLTISNNIIIGLSLIALSAFFIGTWLKSTRAFTLWLKIIFNLFFTDFLLSLSNLLTNFSKEDPAACQAEGFLRTFSLWSSTLWANIIALVAFYKTVKSSLTIDRKYKTFLIVAYGWPFILAILPTIPGLPFKYESNGIVCWVMVSDSYSDYYILLKWAYLFFWVWVAIIFTTVLYILLYRFLKKYSIEAVFTQYRGILIFPVILYITLIPVTIGNTGINHRYPFAMAVTQVFTLNTLGLFHIAAYGYQRLRAMASMKKSLSQKIRIHEESSVSSSLETIFDEYPVIEK